MKKETSLTSFTLALLLLVVVATWVDSSHSPRPRILRPLLIILTRMIVFK